jgi:hypothetical protein
MKTLAARWVIASIVLAAASFAFAGVFKSKIVTATTGPLVITVPDDHVLKITNFSQDGGTERGVVQVTLEGDAESTGTANILTATRVDFSSGANSQNFPEISNRIFVAGPAQVKVRPVTGGTLFITYRKESNDGGGGGGGGSTPFPIFVSPTPFPTITPVPTATVSGM